MPIMGVARHSRTPIILGSQPVLITKDAAAGITGYVRWQRGLRSIVVGKIQGFIDNGYIRLAGLIRGVFIPKRCRVCGGELDSKFKKRGYGYLCLPCLGGRRRSK